MANERITEELVRKHIRAWQQEDRCSNIIWEEQKSKNPRINALLQGASKSGSGVGKPEFIVHNIPNEPNLVVVVECKATLKDHESDNWDKPSQYAVDGVLHYAKCLGMEYHVLAIAVSGEDPTNLKISHYYIPQGKTPDENHQIFGNTLLSLDDYIGGINKDEAKRREKYDALIQYARDLNQQLHTLKIKEDKRSILLSGILISLKHKPFKKSYKEYDTDLPDFTYNTIQNMMRKEGLQSDKLDILMQGYSLIKTHKALAKQLRYLIDQVDDTINGYACTFEYYDFLGQFYIEFLKYSNSDKGLGIVLTPKHITDFMVEVACINKDDVVFDNCTGTGGFLISAMHRMIQDAQGDTSTEKSIKQSQLYGIELQNEIYPLAVSNMYLHGDGKSNIINGSCFDTHDIKKIKSVSQGKDFTKGFLNPPYKSKADDTEELEFILNNLNMLGTGGTCVAIIPMSCVIAQNGNRLALKQQLLDNHTLEAVFSMPSELFHNSKVGVVTAIVVITAHRPHPKNYQTFFGYYRDDGFEKRKHIGRVDIHNKWKGNQDTGETGIKDEWMDLFHNKTEKTSISIKKVVTPEDEWCCEAYMETDYSQITADDFEKAIREYVAFQTTHT